MTAAYGWAAVVLVSVATLAIGTFGLRFSRTTSDFYVASRSVGPFTNATAIGGEYLSAASFLGVAGLVLAYGADMLWFGVGWTAGYLVLLVLVAAPLRRSGAYTIPDFAEVRLESLPVRRLSTVLVAVIGWLYLLPQFQGAGLTLRTVTGAPGWLGGVLVAGIVLVNVLAGGMRSITFVQAFQYWMKLTALLVPLVFLLLAVRGRSSTPAPIDWVAPLSNGDSHALYKTYSLIIATFLGTMGLPHVLVRFYTNPDGRAARRTTLVVLGLLSTFYLLPTAYGVLARLYASNLAGPHMFDSAVLSLPGRLIGGDAGSLLTALVTAGAFAAFLSTSSGLTVSVAGVLAQDVLSRRFRPIPSFRIAAVAAVLVPVILAISTQPLGVADTVSMAFAVAASTFCPLLVLGVWWPRLTDVGAALGLLAGGISSGGAVIATVADPNRSGWVWVALAQPAAWTVPLGFGAMIVGSLATSRRIAPNVTRTMVRLHTPEQVDVDRGSWQPAS
ncbi:MAG: cation acetate symporter [Nocardioidaceae bacterium]